MILVFDRHATKEDLLAGNKIRCALQNVVSCIRTEVYNGMYELEIKSVIDDNVRNHIKRKMIIKSPSGQFFIVYWMQYDSSTQLVTIKAKHIFYYLSSRLVIHGDLNNVNCWEAIEAVKDDEPQEEGFLSYGFFAMSHIDERHDVNYFGEPQGYAIIGDPNSIVNTWGGVLYRDNFYFSIEKVKEGARENAFLIKDGWNTTGIKVTVDDSDSASAIFGYDNAGSTMYGVYTGPSDEWPYATVRRQTYSYSNMTQMSQDVDAYYAEHVDALVSFDVPVVSIRNTNKDSPWLELENYGVGDSGTVYSDILGRVETQRIIEQRYDELAQRTISVKLGNYRNSITNPDRYSKILAKDDSAGRRLDVLERNNVISLIDVE